MGKFIDLTGKKFGKLIVIKKSERKNSVGIYYWECLCDCGNKKTIFGDSLKGGVTKSCGCLRTENLIGKKFGKLTVVKKSGKRGNNGETFWECLCDCGNTKTLIHSKIKANRVKSCGCLKKTTHGKTNTRIYFIWINIKSRCFNKKNPNYKYYGGRGITVCKEWLNSEVFINWALENGYDEKLSIDRINNNGNYEPGNCKWATNLEQSRNRRTTTKFTFNGVQKTLTEWAEQYNVNKYTAKNRYRAGKSFEEIFEINKEKK